MEAAPDSRSHYYLGVALLRTTGRGRRRFPCAAPRPLAPAPNPALALSLGTALLRSGDSEAAVAVLAEAAERHARAAPILLQLGYAHYTRLDGEAARAVLLRAREAAPDDPLAHFYLGLAEAALGSLAPAAAAFREAVRLDPAEPEARVALARTLSRLGRAAEARQQYREALEAAPGAPAALVGIGTLDLAAGDPEAATGAFRSALRRAPRHRQALYNLATALALLGREEEAAEVRRRFHEAAAAGDAPGDAPGRSLSRTAARRKPPARTADARGAPVVRGPRGNPRCRPRRNLHSRGRGLPLRGPHRRSGDPLPPRGRRERPALCGRDRRGRGAGPRLRRRRPARSLLRERRAAAGDPGGATAGNRLFRNRGGGAFTDRTREAGLLDPPGVFHYGMGGVAGDLDHDGDADLFLTHFGEERLFRNRGDGTFEEASGAAGASDPRWTTSAALFDPDRDGDLDIYAANYLDYALATHRDCVSPVRELLAYCHPQEYPGAADSFFENRGDGTFGAVPVPGSEDGKGLGVVVTDLGQDGAPEVQVANDTTPNFLFRTESGPAGVRFLEDGLASGVAYNEEGLPEAGMGTDFGDVDRDGRMDLIVTNFDFETNTLYRNLGGGLFLDATAAFGIGGESLTELGFGCDLADFDNDGWLDLAVTNGHILDNIAEIQSNLTFAQPGQIFRNEGGALRRSRPERGGLRPAPRGAGARHPRLRPRWRPRPRAGEQPGPAELLENLGGAEAGGSAGFVLGTEANRDGIGASLTVRGGGHAAQREERRAGCPATSASTIRCSGSASARRRTRGRSRSGGPRGGAERRCVLKEGRGRIGGERLGAPEPGRAR